MNSLPSFGVSQVLLLIFFPESLATLDSWFARLINNNLGLPKSRHKGAANKQAGLNHWPLFFLDQIPLFKSTIMSLSSKPIQISLSDLSQQVSKTLTSQICCYNVSLELTIQCSTRHAFVGKK